MKKQIYIQIKFPSDFVGKDFNSKDVWVKNIKRLVEEYNTQVGAVYRTVDDMFGITKVQEY